MGKKLIRQVPMTKDVEVVKNIKSQCEFSSYSCQWPFIYVGINIYYVERRILQLLGQNVPHRMKTSLAMATRLAGKDVGVGKCGKSNGNGAKRAMARKRAMAGPVYKKK